jgi:hypothetical protein
VSNPESVVMFCFVFVFFLNRFDVSGVHPKSKYPGTFTEIPYDKKSIDELVSMLNGFYRVQVNAVTVNIFNELINTYYKTRIQ